MTPSNAEKGKVWRAVLMWDSASFNRWCLRHCWICAYLSLVANKAAVGCNVLGIGRLGVFITLWLLRRCREHYRMAEASRDLIELDSVGHSANDNGAATAQSRIYGSTVVPRASLCEECQDFDIQAFAKAPSQRLGYPLHQVEAGSIDGCTFCSMLFACVNNLKTPENPYLNQEANHATRSQLFVHMTMSRDYAGGKRLETSPLSANRLLIELGDRFSELRSVCEDEICIAADPGWYFKQS